MEFTDFPQSNFTFLAPKDMPECKDLKVYREITTHVDGSGNLVESGIIISRLTMSEQEREEFIKTGDIWFIITGLGMPPIGFYAKSPFVGFIDEETKIDDL